MIQDQTVQSGIQSDHLSSKKANSQESEICCKKHIPKLSKFEIVLQLAKIVLMIAGLTAFMYYKGQL